MPARDYTSAPIADQLGLPAIIAGLCSDLDKLRQGEISVNDAIARSMLAKQIFNGVRIYMNGTKLLADNARAIGKPWTPRDSDGSGEAGETALAGSTVGESAGPKDIAQ
jgi:hypothetical protein